jgi:anti-sigma B factor antagonist
MVEPQRAAATVISLDGEFDFASRERLNDAFSAALRSPLIVVDLGLATYIDSTVLGCLLGLSKAATEAGSTFVIVGASAFARRLFTVTALEKVFDIRNTLRDAIPTEAANLGSIERIRIVETDH